MYIIYNKVSKEYFLYFNCADGTIWWTTDSDRAHKFKSEDSSRFVVDSFKLENIEIISK